MKDISKDTQTGLHKASTPAEDLNSINGEVFPAENLYGAQDGHLQDLSDSINTQVTAASPSGANPDSAIPASIDSQKTTAKDLLQSFENELGMKLADIVEAEFTEFDLSDLDRWNLYHTILQGIEQYAEGNKVSASINQDYFFNSIIAPMKKVIAGRFTPPSRLNEDAKIRLAESIAGIMGIDNVVHFQLLSKAVQEAMDLHCWLYQKLPEKKMILLWIRTISQRIKDNKPIRKIEALPDCDKNIQRIKAQLPYLSDQQLTSARQAVFAGISFLQEISDKKITMPQSRLNEDNLHYLVLFILEGSQEKMISTIEKKLKEMNPPGRVRALEGYVKSLCEEQKTEAGQMTSQESEVLYRAFYRLLANRISQGGPQESARKTSDQVHFQPIKQSEDPKKVETQEALKKLNIAISEAGITDKIRTFAESNARLHRNKSKEITPEKYNELVSFCNASLAAEIARVESKVDDCLWEKLKGKIKGIIDKELMGLEITVRELPAESNAKIPAVEVEIDVKSTLPQQTLHVKDSIATLPEEPLPEINAEESEDNRNRAFTGAQSSVVEIPTTIVDKAVKISTDPALDHITEGGKQEVETALVRRGKEAKLFLRLPGWAQKAVYVLIAAFGITALGPIISQIGFRHGVQGPAVTAKQPSRQSEPRVTSTSVAVNNPAETPQAPKPFDTRRAWQDFIQKMALNKESKGDNKVAELYQTGTVTLDEHGVGIEEKMKEAKDALVQAVQREIDAAKKVGDIQAAENMTSRLKDLQANWKKAYWAYVKDYNKGNRVEKDANGTPTRVTRLPNVDLSGIRRFAAMQKWMDKYNSYNSGVTPGDLNWIKEGTGVVVIPTDREKARETKTTPDMVKALMDLMDLHEQIVTARLTAEARAGVQHDRQIQQRLQNTTPLRDNSTRPSFRGPRAFAFDLRNQTRKAATEYRDIKANIINFADPVMAETGTKPVQNADYFFGNLAQRIKTEEQDQNPATQVEDTRQAIADWNSKIDLPVTPADYPFDLPVGVTGKAMPQEQSPSDAIFDIKAHEIPTDNIATLEAQWKSPKVNNPNLSPTDNFFAHLKAQEPTPEETSQAVKAWTKDDLKVENPDLSPADNFFAHLKAQEPTPEETSQAINDWNSASSPVEPATAEVKPTPTQAPIAVETPKAEKKTLWGKLKSVFTWG